LAIPALLARMNSAKPGVRGSAIYALGSTGSREAVPLLISLLNVSPFPNEKASMEETASANAALQQLTHHYLPRPLPEAWVDSARQRWQEWWLDSGQEAKIYRPGECAPDTPLS
jgi:hypothetical protein